MSFTILHRTILWELTRVFLLSLLGITGILLMAGIVSEASRHGLNPAQVLAAIPLIVPSTLPYTIPATTLFATCVVYGRLAADNEILAIKAAGVNIMQVVGPGIFLGVVMTGVTVGLYFHLIPTTHHMMRTIILNDVEGFLYAMLKQNGEIKHHKLNYEMFVKRVQGRKLLDTQFMRKDTKTGQYDVIARAREAELRVNLPRKLLLVHMRHCFISSSDPGDVGYVEDKVWDVELPKEIVDQRRKFRPADMTWDELHQAQDEITLQLEKLDSDITLTTARVALAKPMDDLPKHLAQLRAMKHQKRLERLNLEAEVLMRPAVGLGCLCFVLVGCPVGIWFSRSDYLSAFITCFLPIVFVYYPLLLCGANLAKTGRVAPLVGVWAADVLMLLIAGVLFRRLVRN